MIYLHNLRFLKDIYLGEGEQHSKPLCKIEFNVIECNRIHCKRFKIMDSMLEQVKLTSEAQSPGLRTQIQCHSTLRV